jgi:hypothetical protein
MAFSAFPRGSAVAAFFTFPRGFVVAAPPAAPRVGFQIQWHRPIFPPNPPLSLHELVIREHFEPFETKILSCAAWSSSMRRPTSFVAAAFTRARQARLPSPWTGRGIWKMDTETEPKKSQTLREFRAENPAGRQSAGILREARGE